MTYGDIRQVFAEFHGVKTHLLTWWLIGSYYVSDTDIDTDNDTNRPQGWHGDDTVTHLLMSFLL